MKQDLLDKFAIAAMQTYLGNHLRNDGIIDKHLDVNKIVKRSYYLAEAMYEEREKRYGDKLNSSSE